MSQNPARSTRGRPGRAAKQARMDCLRVRSPLGHEFSFAGGMRLLIRTAAHSGQSDCAKKTANPGCPVCAPVPEPHGARGDGPAVPRSRHRWTASVCVPRWARAFFRRGNGASYPDCRTFGTVGMYQKNDTFRLSCLCSVPNILNAEKVVYNNLLDFCFAIIKTKQSPDLFRGFPQILQQPE